MNLPTLKGKVKRTPVKRQMAYLSNWIHQELKRNRAARINPFALQMSDRSWKIIRQALNKASKP